METNHHEIIDSPGIFAVGESDIIVSSLIKLWHVFLVGFEPAILRVWGGRDNRNAACKHGFVRQEHLTHGGIECNWLCVVYNKECFIYENKCGEFFF